MEKVELTQREYSKLKKDANDNRQIVRIVIIVSVVLLILVGYFAYGRKATDLFLERQKAAMQNELIIEKAKANVVAREIEQDGMSNEEYFKWLEVRDELYSDTSSIPK